MARSGRLRGRSPRSGRLTRRLGFLTLVAWTAACGEPAPRHAVIPLPMSVDLSETDTFYIAEGTRVTFDEGDLEGERIGHMLAGWIGNTVETTPDVLPTGAGSAPSGPAVGPTPGPDIHFTREGADASLGDEGYELVITDSLATVRANTPVGFLYGAQTIRQLLPPIVEYTAAYPRPLFFPTGRIVDRPRFEWRGAMLDVARHFRPVDDVKRFVDLMALYKLNRLHLHLSDDQGWRIEIRGWPRLTEHGGSTQVGGLGGGYYTVEEYTEIVDYAAERFITVVPEIDVPGHTNAALSSYPELSCDGQAPELYTGTEVGFSSLCTNAEITYDFLDDVIGEIAALTPGPYFHVGGDEARQTESRDYIAFIERVQDIAESHGKRMIGWDEVATARLSSRSLVQLWRPLWPDPGAPVPEGPAAEAARVLEEGADRAVEVGARFILSPADRIYLDMKYDTATVIGLQWAGLSDPRHAYEWEPNEVFAQIPEASIAGVEGTLWSETMGSLDDIEYLAFPRLAGVAEMGWSAAGAREWDEYRRRLGAHGARWTALGVNFHRSPQIDWTLDPS